MKLARLLWVVSAAGASCGCVSAAQSATSTEPTLVAVSPDDFLGQVPCADAPGAMRTYAATLWDVTPGLLGDGSAVHEFALPSSGPVSCLQNVAFGGGFVIPGHEYVADIQAYDRTGLEQLGGASSGSPMLVDSKTGAFVAPRWTTSCGRGAPLEAGATDASKPDASGAEAGATDASKPDASGVEGGTQDASKLDANGTEGGTSLGANSPAFAAANQTVFVRDCAPLIDRQTAGPTGITVGLDAAALGALSCGSGADQIERFTAQLQGSSGAPKGAACGSSVEFASLSAGQSYNFQLDAYAAGATSPGWATNCYATALKGTVIAAACDPLTDQGGISVDIPGVLASLGLSCGGQLLSITTTLPGSPSVTQTPPGCSAPVVFANLAAGSYAIGITTRLSSGSAGPSANCIASALPGRVTQAVCSQN